MRVDLSLMPTGSSVVTATWETDTSALRTPTEQFARETFAEVCLWVLGFGAGSLAQ